jgi:hypothetical protein
MDAHYVESLRNGTAYPNLRKAIGLFTALLGGFKDEVQL